MPSQIRTKTVKRLNSSIYKFNGILRLFNDNIAICIQNSADISSIFKEFPHNVTVYQFKKIVTTMDDLLIEADIGYTIFFIFVFKHFNNKKRTIQIQVAVVNLT